MAKIKIRKGAPQTGRQPKSPHTPKKFPGLEAQIAKCPDPKPGREPECILVHLVEMLRAGYRSQAVCAVRFRSKSVAQAEAIVGAIEWAMKEPTIRPQVT